MPGHGRVAQPEGGQPYTVMACQQVGPID